MELLDGSCAVLSLSSIAGRLLNFEKFYNNNKVMTSLNVYRNTIAFGTFWNERALSGSASLFGPPKQ